MKKKNKLLSLKNPNELNKEEIDNLTKNILDEYNSQNKYDVINAKNNSNNSSKSNNSHDYVFLDKSKVNNYYSKIYEPTNLNKCFFNQCHFSKSLNELHLTKKNVTITEDINSIQDLLNIIQKYPYEPLHNYNINLKALHNIKSPLQKLNSMIGMNNLKNSIQLIFY